MNTTTFSRKTIAIALAAGMTLGGVTVATSQGVGPLSAQAAAAEAGKLDPSVIKSHAVIADKSSAAITNADTFSDIAGRNAFVDKHGTNVNFDVNMEIPNDAKSGDSIAFKINGAFVPNMKNGNGRDVHAKGKNGENFVIGAWKYNDTDKTVTFTLSKDASEYQDRKVHIQVPMRINPIGIETTDANLKGKAKAQVGTVTLASTGAVLDEFKYSAPYEYAENKGNIHIWTYDNPIRLNANRHGLNEGRLKPDVNTGTFHGAIHEMRTGQANGDYDNNYASVSSPDLKIAYDPAATEMRNFTVRYTIDNDNFHFEKGQKPSAWWSRGLDTWKVNEEGGQQHFTAYEHTNGLKDAFADGFSYDVKVSEDGKTADLIIKNMPPHNALNLFEAVDVVGDYNPGDKFTIKGKFVNGVGQPKSAYAHNYTETAEFTYTMPSFAEDGSGVKYVKKAEMKALVNGKDANDKNSAEQITGGKGKFSIDLKNTGTIGASKATVKFPNGVTDANGKTERVIDLSDGSFGPGKTKKIDLGELNVPKGVQENKFTVEMNGFESMSDPAWTVTGPTGPSDIYVDNVEKQDNGDYLVTRNDGKTWTIELSELNKRIKDLEDKDTVSPEDFKKVQDDLKKAQDGINGLKGKDAEIDKELGKLRNDLNDLKPRVDKLEERVTKLEGLVIKEVKDNGDGTYTLIRVDGSKVKGNIDTGDNITKIVDNGDGSITITRGDGSTEKVNLSQTTVTETNKGKPNHTITITTPDGKKVTFNAFDVYVTDVKKNAKGDYDIYRSDVNDGKTVWKTIVLSDIRSKITKLEGDLTKLNEKQAADVKDIKDQIDGLEKEIESLQGAQDDLDKRVTTLETKVSALTLRVTNLEKRVKGLEETDAAWAKCYAGIGATGVPMLLALPLALMSDLNIPGLNQLNTQIQRTIGIYNPEAAKWMSENRGLFSAATGVLTAAGVLGMLIHTAKECQPYNKTPGVQDNMNPIIEGSSKIAEKVDSGSSKAEGEDNGSSVGAGSSAGEGSSTDAGSSTDNAEGSAMAE